MKRIVAIIPARLQSTRFPEKVLTPIHGKPLILHVVERIKGSNISDIIVATDHPDIKEVVERKTDCQTVMTRDDHPCGTDRIAEVATRVSADYVLNVQGDELLSGPDMVNDIISHIDENLNIATLYSTFLPNEKITDVNIVKVLPNLTGNIIYMSRAPIPFQRNGRLERKEYFKQVGIYLFQREMLIEFSKLKPSRLEKIEGIELLRAIEYDIPLRGIYSDKPTCDVNVPEDITNAEKFVKIY